jgi:hypothetical protein
LQDWYRRYRDMKNILGREIPEHIEGYGRVKPFAGAFADLGEIYKKEVKVRPALPGQGKVLESIKDVIKECGLKDGMTVSFHHHLRNGDYVLNMVMDEIANAELKDIKVAFFVKRTFGNLEIGHDQTLDDGTAATLFPADLPGGTSGELKVIAAITDPPLFGDVRAEADKMMLRGTHRSEVIRV